MATANSKEGLREAAQDGKLTWTWPLIMVFARLVLAIIAQALVARLFALRGHPTPWQAVAPWWVVYGTLIDVGCLAALWWLARREGLRLADLITFQRDRLGRDLLVGLGFVVVYFALFFAGGMIFGPVFYGGQGPLPYGPLPLWGALFSVIVWPLTWGLAEQLIYNGYAFPASRRSRAARGWRS